MANIIIIFIMALVWSFLVSEIRAYNLVVGGLIGVLILTVIQRGEPYSFVRRTNAFVKFVYRFFVELVVANFTIARLTLQPKVVLHPHIIAVPLKVQSDQAISLLAITITLLPGTVAMGVSDDKKILYAHAIGIEDVTQAQESVSKIETLILGFMT